MAPRIKYTREEMVEAALRVVREKGIDALTAKALASELGVSTQPVFTCFHTIEEAKREVRTAAQRVYDRYVEDGLHMKIPFLGVGMQYIHFAKEEPQLYRLLFLTTSEDGSSSVMNALHHSQNLVRESLQQTYHIDAQAADRYYRDMWLVVHSLATLVVTGTGTGGCPYTEEEIGHILTGFSVSLCKSIKEIPGFVENKYDRDAIFQELVEK
ncbi:MAG: TetR/AcrR family transcriptional regulator [Clostridiales bacterium]|nr:TetR/AcrR family transcriptional regulator [Clostridiales bacterium]